MTKTVADFEIPELPGENLVVCFGTDDIAFLGDEVGQSITTEPNGAVYVEDWC